MTLARTGFKRQPLPERRPLAWPGPQHFSAPAVMAAVVPVPKDPAPMRSKLYLRLVASLECFNCRIQGHSQAAHPNNGKAKGRKACDSLTFPMCCVSGRDCHTRLDHYKLVSRADMPDFERRAYQWTVRTLVTRGIWPALMELPDLRDFDA
jgi:hypothetical protein